jgi:hypothetical protein
MDAGICACKETTPSELAHGGREAARAVVTGRRGHAAYLVVLSRPPSRSRLGVGVHAAAARAVRHHRSPLLTASLSFSSLNTAPSIEPAASSVRPGRMRQLMRQRSAKTLRLCLPRHTHPWVCTSGCPATLCGCVPAGTNALGCARTLAHQARVSPHAQAPLAVR